MSVISAPTPLANSVAPVVLAGQPNPDAWALWMHWCDLHFASWKVPVEVMRKIVPSELEIDTFDGSAWVSLVSLRVDEMHWNGLPPLPGMDRLRELNLRTYTTRDGKPGVYFLSIDCPAAIPDWIGRHIFGQPFNRAEFAYYNDLLTYQIGVERTQDNQRLAALYGDFTPVGEAYLPEPGTLAHFLVNRLCLYFVGKEGVYRGDIFHPEFHLRDANTNFRVNTVLQANGFDGLPAKPDHAVFSSGVDVQIWLPVQVSGQATNDKPADTNFHFSTVWEIDSPLKPVWDALYHFEDWHTWWKGVEAVQIRNPGDSNRIGFRTSQTWTGVLPYSLHFETEVKQINPMSLIKVASSGDLKGTGLLRFESRGNRTLFQVDWDVSPTKLWMRALAPLLRPVFAWNHRILMGWGAQGLAPKLGISPIVTTTLGVL